MSAVGRRLAGVVAVAFPAAAQGPERLEVGASLVNLMVVIPQEGTRAFYSAFRQVVSGC